MTKKNTKYVIVSQYVGEKGSFFREHPTREAAMAYGRMLQVAENMAVGNGVYRISLMKASDHCGEKWDDFEKNLITLDEEEDDSL